MTPQFAVGVSSAACKLQFSIRACLKIQTLDKTGCFLSNAIPMALAWPLLTSARDFGNQTLNNETKPAQ
jgi:hypothetical protein